MTTFFFDNNLAPRYARMLKALDVDVIHLQELFAPDTKDEQWLPELRDSGWTLVTIDRAITRDPVNALALKESGITAIFIPRGVERLSRWDQAAWLITRWAIIDAFAQRARTGQI